MKAKEHTKKRKLKEHGTATKPRSIGQEHGEDHGQSHL